MENVSWELMATSAMGKPSSIAEVALNQKCLLKGRLPYSFLFLWGLPLHPWVVSCFLPLFSLCIWSASQYANISGKMSILLFDPFKCFPLMVLFPISAAASKFVIQHVETFDSVAFSLNTFLRMASEGRSSMFLALILSRHASEDPLNPALKRSTNWLGTSPLSSGKLFIKIGEPGWPSKSSQFVY